MKKIIELQNIKRNFQVGDETVHALRGISFTIYEGGVDIMCEVSERIMERGRKIGEEQGRKKQARSTALNLSQMGLTPEQIAGAVGESLEQVKNWLAGAKPAN